MRIANLSSPGTVDVIGKASSMLSVHPTVWVNDPEYRRKMRSFSEKGQYIYMLADPQERDIVDPSLIDEVAVPYRSDDDYDDFLRRVESVPSGVGVSVLLIAGDRADIKDMYMSVGDIEAYAYVSSIAIPVSPDGFYADRDIDLGFHRAELIRDLVDSGHFHFHLPHHLYGMLNPVEAVLYQQEFGGFINGAIRSVSSAALFLSALYGMRISERVGFYSTPPSRSAEYPLVDVPDELTLTDGFNTDQTRMLQSNNRVIGGLLSGSGGEPVLEEYRSMKEIGI